MLKSTAGDLPLHGWESDFHNFVEENECSLKERFDAPDKTRKMQVTITVLLNAWNMLLTSIAVLSALIGLLSLLIPTLRFCQISLFTQFLEEVGLF